MKRYSAFFICLSLFLCSLGISAKDIQTGIEELEVRIPQMMQDWNVPGMSVAIVHGDRVIFAKGFGKIQIDKETPVDADTLFGIGSTTKAFTCAALALLVEKGEFNFDTPVRNLLPSLRWNSKDLEDQVTVSDLVTHFTGLEESDLVWYKTNLSRDEILNRLRFVKSEAPFRSTFIYNNLTYLAAGQIIPQVTGQSWDKFIQENLLKPLNMENTLTSVAEAEKSKNVASPHMTIAGSATVIEREDNDKIGPAASIYSSANDMSKWVRFLLNRGKINDKQLLSSGMIDQLWKQRVPLSLDSIYAMGYPETSFVGYGLGWFLHDYYGHPIMEHLGVIDGMHALVALLPESGLGIVVLTNSGNIGLPMTLKYTLLDSYFDIEPTDWHNLFLYGIKVWEQMQSLEEQRAYENRMLNTIPTLKLDQYTGTFHNDLYGELKISAIKGKLYLDFHAFHGFLEHWQNDTFYSDFTDTMPALPLKGMLTFELDAENRVSDLIIQNSAMNATFQKSLME